MPFEFTLYDVLLCLLAAVGAASLGVWIGDRFRPAPPPKPKEWTLQFNAPDGYPVRNYTIDEKEMHRLMNQLHHYYYEK